MDKNIHPQEDGKAAAKVEAEVKPEVREESIPCDLCDDEINSMFAIGVLNFNVTQCIINDKEVSCICI